MENKDSQIFGGIDSPENERGIFPATENGETRQPERFVPDNLRSMGEGALEGLNDLPMPETDEMSLEVAQIVREGGEISAEEEIGGNGLTSDGLKVIREAAQRTVPETKGHPDQMEAKYQEKRRETLIALGHYAIGGDN
ncbi:hypothetical protein IJ096_01330 [Candidatus Saccharibacteria bacterium]|nr:hypothetical protein [Candidatus Saccharibacteria bacterium]